MRSARVGGRLEFVNREYALSFTVRLSATSQEFADLRALTTGSATIGLSGGVNDYLSVLYPSTTFAAYSLGTDSAGMALVQIVCTTKSDPTLGPLVVTAKNSVLTGIGTVG